MVKRYRSESGKKKKKWESERNKVQVFKCPPQLTMKIYNDSQSEGREGKRAKLPHKWASQN